MSYALDVVRRSQDDPTVGRFVRAFDGTVPAGGGPDAQHVRLQLQAGGDEHQPLRPRHRHPRHAGILVQNLTVTGSVPRRASALSKLVVAAGPALYLGDLGYLAAADAAALHPTNRACLCYIDGNAYAVDGLNSRQVNLRTGVVTPIAAGGGLGTFPDQCKIAVAWHGG